MQNKKKGLDKSKIEEHRKQKLAYSQSLKKNIKNLADQYQLESFSIFEKIRDVVPDHLISNKTGTLLHEALESDKEFVDQGYAPTMENLQPLKRENMGFISWFRIMNFFKDGKFCLFNDFSLKKQVLRDRGYSHIVDAMNALSTQPCLVIRLFEYTETNKKGVYSIWLNVNGMWKETIIDDYVPIFSYDEKGKAQFYFSSPNLEKREIWMILLQKALAKAYGGFDRLYNGNSNYILRDLTGAPVKTHPIIYIAGKQKITQREVKHMHKLFRKISKSLQKGYVLSVIPRNPNKMEQKRNMLLQVFNKKYFLGNGIYSGHEYSILSARTIRSSKGTEAMVIQLRNPWINEKWDGDWSKDSDLWTDELRKELGYNPEANGENQFWICIKDAMNFFEHLQICKAIPGYTYNSIKLKYPKKTYLRAVIRFHIQVKGKYTISVDQKDLHFLKDKRFRYNHVKLTLCKLENGEFTLLSHTSSETLRNTFIRKLIDEGEYYVLIEEKVNPSSLEAEKEAIDSGNKEYYSKIKHWRNSVFSIYGPKTCGIKIIECEDIHVIHDYLLYEGWKNYAKQRIGNKLTDFKLTFDDGHKGDLAIYLLGIPKLIVYAFKNINNYGVDINTEIMGITNMEIVGPEGKVGFNQHFKINSNQHDVFILRETEVKEDPNHTSSPSFKMKSIVGTRYQGEKEKSKNQAKVYDFLFFDKPFTNGCMIEKYPQLKISSLYDCFGNAVRRNEDQQEIRMKTKSIVEAVKVEDDEDIGEFVIEDKMVQPKAPAPAPVVPPKPVPKTPRESNQEKKVGFQDQQKPQTKQDLELIEQEEALKRQREQQEMLIARKNELIEQQRQQQALIEQQKQQQAILEHRKQQQLLMQQEQERKEMEELEQKIAEESRRQSMQQRNSARTETNHRSRNASIPKTSPKPPVPNKRQQNNHNMEADNQKTEAITMDDARLAHLLALSKEEILQINNEELLQLIKYTGIDAFVNLYQADHEYLERLYSKLGDQQEPQEVQEQEVEPVYQETYQQIETNIPEAKFHSRGSFEPKAAPQPSTIQSYQKMQPVDPLLSPDNFQKDFSMVDKKPSSRYQKKVSRPSFLDKPKQQDPNLKENDYHKIEFEYNNASLKINPQSQVQHNPVHHQNKLAHLYQDKSCKNYEIPGIGDSPQNFAPVNNFISQDPHNDVNNFGSPKREVVVDNFGSNQYGVNPHHDRRSFNQPSNINGRLQPINQNRGHSYQHHYQQQDNFHQSIHNLQVVDSDKYINTGYNSGYPNSQAYDSNNNEPNLMLESYQEQMMKPEHIYVKPPEVEYTGGYGYGPQGHQKEDPMNIEIAEPFQSNYFNTNTERYDSQGHNSNFFSNHPQRYNTSNVMTSDPRNYHASNQGPFAPTDRSPSNNIMRGNASSRLPNEGTYSRNEPYAHERYGNLEAQNRIDRSRSRRRPKGNYRERGNQDRNMNVQRIPYRREQSRDSHGRNIRSRSPLHQNYQDARDALTSIPVNNNFVKDSTNDPGFQLKNNGSLLQRGFNPGSKRNVRERAADGRLRLRGSGRRIDHGYLSRDASMDQRSYNL